MTGNIALEYRQSGGTYIFKPAHTGPSKSARPDATGLEEGTIYLAREEGQACVVVEGQWSDWFDLRGADWNTNVANKPTLGTAAALDAGTAAGQLVRLDADGALPAIDGGKLTNLPTGTGGDAASTAYSNATSGLAATDVQAALDELDATLEGLAPVATTGAYADLTGTPGLGTAAGHDAGDFATAAQGVLADGAVQPGDLAAVATTGEYGDLVGTPTLGTAAALDAGTAAGQLVRLDADGALPAIDGGKLTNLPSGDGVGTTNAYVETTLATSGTAGYGHVTLDLAAPAWVGTVPPAAAPTNYARAASAYTNSGGSNVADVTMMGLPGKTFARGTEYGDHLRISDLLPSASLTNGAKIHVAVLWQPGGADTKFDLMIEDATAGYDWIECHTNGTVQQEYINTVPIGDTFDAAESYVVDIGNGYYVAKIVMNLTGAFTNDAVIGVGGPQKSTEVHEFCGLFVGIDEEYVPDGSGDAAKVNVPGYTTPASLTLDMTADRVQVATLDDGGVYELALPTPPAAGEWREHYAYVQLSGGSSLALPTGAGITARGDAGPFSSEVDVFVLVRGDGTRRLWAQGS